MSFKNLAMPKGTNFMKFSDYENGAVVTFTDIETRQGKYGIEYHLVSGTDRLKAPSRYNETFEAILKNPEYLAEFKEGTDMIVSWRQNASKTKTYGNLEFLPDED